MIQIFKAKFMCSKDVNTEKRIIVVQDLGMP
jgi:hypothetical protein